MPGSMPGPQGPVEASPSGLASLRLGEGGAWLLGARAPAAAYVLILLDVACPGA